MFPWGRVKHTVTEGRPGMTVLHQPGTASPWKCSVGEQSSLEMQAVSRSFCPLFPGAGQEAGELMLNLGIYEVAAGLQSDALQPMGSPSLVVLV